MIACGFIFCIYQKDGACTLEQIDINDLGVCAVCMLPSIKNIEEIKARARKELDKRFLAKN